LATEKPFAGRPRMPDAFPGVARADAESRLLDVYFRPFFVCIEGDILDQGPFPSAVRQALENKWKVLPPR
jgi:hypothetical protein